MHLQRRINSLIYWLNLKKMVDLFHLPRIGQLVYNEQKLCTHSAGEHPLKTSTLMKQVCEQKWSIAMHLNNQSATSTKILC